MSAGLNTIKPTNVCARCLIWTRAAAVALLVASISASEMEVMEGTVDGLTDSVISDTSSSKDKIRRNFGARLGP